MYFFVSGQFLAVFALRLKNVFVRIQIPKSALVSLRHFWQVVDEVDMRVEKLKMP